MANVVTYSTRLRRLSICMGCEIRMEAAGIWPRDRAGQELVDVDHGLHDGRCNICAGAPIEQPALGEAVDECQH